MGLRLSRAHGVNPSVEQCFVCMKDMGVVLFGKLKASRGNPDPEAPRQVCFGPNSEPCSECKEWMKKGIIAISVDEEKTEDMQNPWRTGGWAVVSDDFITRVVTPPELANDILEKRMVFLPDEAWDMLGLPRGEADG